MKFLLAMLFTGVLLVSPKPSLRGRYCEEGKAGCSSYLSFENDSIGVLTDFEKGNLWPFHYKAGKKNEILLYHNLDTTLIGKFKVVNDSTLMFGKIVYKK